jgi:hypothetical protein
MADIPDRRALQHRRSHDHTPARVGMAIMKAFGLKSDDKKCVMEIDLHLGNREATLTVTYKGLRHLDLEEIKESFKIVPKDEDTQCPPNQNL